jgi:hypothetical protein
MASWRYLRAAGGWVRLKVHGRQRTQALAREEPSARRHLARRAQMNVLGVMIANDVKTASRTFIAAVKEEVGPFD